MGYKYIENEYIDCLPEHLKKCSTNSVKMICDYCYGEFDVKINSFFRWDKNRDINVYKCINCYRKNISDFSLESRRDYIYDKIKKICGKYNYELISNISDICNVNSIIKYKCYKHGIKERRAHLFVYGEHECPDCKNENSKLSPERIKQLINERGSEVLNWNEYVNTITSNLKIKCCNCNNIFETSFNSFYYTRNKFAQCCPDCSKKYSSGEIKIKHFLEKMKINYIPQYRFEDCKDKNTLPFDFYLPDYNAIIEFDGEQHYSPISFGNNESNYEYIKLHDEYKNKYCQENNILLIRIPYYKFNSIEEIITKNIINLYDDIV